MVGDKQIGADIVHGCGPLVEHVRGFEMIPGGGPQSSACLSKLISCRAEIAL